MVEKEKIAFICHPYHRGGVTGWMADAAIAYSKRNYTTYFITTEPKIVFYSGRGRDTMLDLLSRVNNSVKVLSAPVGREFEFGLIEYDAYIYQQLIIKNVPPGTPLILSDDAAIWMAAAGLKDSYPVVGVLHSDSWDYYGLVLKYSKEVSIFACVSERVSKFLKEKPEIFNAENIFIIPCGVEFPEVNNNRTISKVLQLVYVGRITNYQKRTVDLIKIAIELHKKNIPYHLTVIGNGDEDAQTEIEQNITEYKLEDCVTFTGWLSKPEVQQHLFNSDIVILTSDSEGMPLAMMEGLASGCGFVGTRVSGIEDYEHHPLAKDCFGVFEIGNIGEAVTRILEVSSVAVDTRRASARQLAEEEFSMDICLDRYNKAIAALPPKSYTKANISFSFINIIKSRIIAMMRTLKMGRADLLNKKSQSNK